MSEPSAGMSQQATEINMQNHKLILDVSARLAEQALTDNQANARAWNAFNLVKAHNSEAFYHWVNMLGVPQGQVGTTEAQQTVSPAGTAASEAIKGAVGTAAAGEAVAAEAVAAAIGQLAQSVVPIMLAAGGVVSAQTLAAVLPVLVTAIGGASTPSQTQSKPTA